MSPRLSKADQGLLGEAVPVAAVPVWALSVALSLPQQDTAASASGYSGLLSNGGRGQGAPDSSWSRKAA